MRLLLLILQFPPDVNSTGLLMAQLGESLVARGHQVDVLTTFPHYERFQVWPEYRGRLFQRDTYRGMRVLRLYVHARGRKQNMLNRLLSYLSFSLLAAAAGLLARRSYDAILCPNGGFLTGIAASVLGAARGVPFVLNVQDLYPETPVRAGQLKDGPAVRVLEWLERYQYRRAAHITVIAPAFRDNLLAKGVPPHKVSVIPNFADVEVIRPLSRDNPWSRRHGLADRFVVAHAGNVGYVYDLETLLHAAARLSAYSDILFLIVGDGVMKPRLQELAGELGLANVRFLPFQPSEDLPWLRAACDVHLSLYRPGSARYSMPSKLYEIMASGRPLVASAEPDSDVRRLVDESGCGLGLEPGDPEALAEAVLRLRADPALRQALAASGRAHAERSYSRTRVADQYERLLASVALPRLAPALSRSKPW